MNETVAYFNNLYEFSVKVTNYISIFPLLFAIWKWRNFNKPIKLIFQYLLALFILEMADSLFIWGATKYYEVLEPYLSKLKIESNNFLGITHSLPDFVFLGWIFSFVFAKQLGSSIQKVSCFLFVLSIIVYFYIDGYNKIGVVNPILDRLYLIIIPVIYFYHLSKSPPILSLWKNPFFLFGLGLFLPNLFSFFVSFYGNKLNETDFPLFVKISIIRNVFTVLAQIFFIMVFLNARFAKFLVKKH